MIERDERPAGSVPSPSGPLRPPEHLSPLARAWWLSLAGEFELEAHHLAMLGAAAECLDRMAEARECIEAEGAIVRDRFGQLRTNPAVLVERDSKTLFARLCREIGFDADPPPDPRLPRSRGRVR